MPSLPGDERPANGVSDWISVQHWAVWQDHLIGLGTLRCDADGGNAAGKDVARVRWRLAPVGRKMIVAEQTASACRFQYGGLQVDLDRLDQRGGFAFSTDQIGQSPHASLTPLLSRAAPWSRRDFVRVATVIRPAGAKARVHLKPLANGAAAVLVEPGERKAYVWVANLERHFQQYLLDQPAEATITRYKHGVEMPVVPPGEPANLGLLGLESGVWVIESKSPIDPKILVAGLRTGKGR